MLYIYIYIYICVCVWIEASYVNVFEPCQLVERQWTSLGVPRNSNNQEAKARPQGSRHLARGRMACFLSIHVSKECEGICMNNYKWILLTYIQTDRRTETDRRTDGQTDRHTDIHTYMYKNVSAHFSSNMSSIWFHSYPFQTSTS